MYRKWEEIYSFISSLTPSLRFIQNEISDPTKDEMRVFVDNGSCHELCVITHWCNWHIYNETKTVVKRFSFNWKTLINHVQRVSLYRTIQKEIRVETSGVRSSTWNSTKYGQGYPRLRPSKPNGDESPNHGPYSPLWRTELRIEPIRIPSEYQIGIGKESSRNRPLNRNTSHVSTWRYTKWSTHSSMRRVGERYFNGLIQELDDWSLWVSLDFVQV